MTLEFTVLQDRYAVVRLTAGATVPEWASRGAFFSITRTPHELSIVCAEEHAPDSGTVSRNWRCLALAGPFAFSEIGIAAEFTGVLANSGVSVLVVSTYDTDYVLIPAGQLDRAERALVAAGHRVAV